MIREGTLDDIPDLLRFGMPVVRRLPGPRRKPEAEACSTYLRTFIDAPSGALFVSEGRNGVNGFICGWLIGDPFTGHLAAVKASWVVDPAQRGPGAALLIHFERWAERMGAEIAFATHLVGDLDTARLLERRGYERTEIKYERQLNGH